MPTQRHPAHRAGIALRVLGVLLTASLHAADAGAVFIDFDLNSPLQLRLRVGPSTGNTVDTVSFPAISGANISPAPSAVTYAPLVDVELSLQRPTLTFPNDVVLTVNSTAGMACVAGSGCGSTVIPFTDVCWTSTNKVAGGGDIQDGCFTSSATQPLARFGWVSFNSRRMYNTLRFTYANARVYPAGQYRGTVTYTATVP
jgi:hypothetical protein